ncbi:MAG: YceI family protein, partial [Chloroflexota bacterium]
MKNVFGLSLLAVLLLVGSAFTTADDFISYNVDTVESVIYWKGYKVTGQHDGIVNIQSGALDYDNGQLVGGNFTIDMSSITVKDLEGDYKAKLEGHLKSEDFFGVEKFPTAKFVITKVMSRGMPGDYRIEGDLTIKETTKPIKFN